MGKKGKRSKKDRPKGLTDSTQQIGSSSIKALDNPACFACVHAFSRGKSCIKKIKIPADLKSKKSRMEYLLRSAGKEWKKVSCAYALQCCKLPPTKTNKNDWYQTKSRYGLSCYKNSVGLERPKPEAHNWNESSSFLSSKFRAKFTEKALENGWAATKAKNRMIIFRDPKRLGWAKWFETGKVQVHVRKPVTEGKKMQLLANAFFNTELISDIKFFTKFFQSFYIKEAHLFYKIGVRLPPFKLEFNNGICKLIVKSDRSHPKGFEIEYMLLKEAERIDERFNENTEALKQFTEFMKLLAAPKRLKDDSSGMVI